jgi:hypothetical protein
MAPKTENFGPFADIPSDSIKPVGFSCRICKHPVRRFCAVVPNLVPRMMFYVCKCGAIAVWEDEKQPKDAQHWRQNIKLLKKAGVGLVVFNGNKPTPASFSGIN